MSNIIELVGQRVKDYRTEKGLSQEELSHICDMPTSYLGKIERCQKNPTLITLDKIINALEVSYEEFFSFGAPPEITEDPIIDKIVSYLKTMSKDEQTDVYKSIKMLIKWKEKQT